MAFSDFTLPAVKKAFQLVTEENTDLFGAVPEVPVNVWLTDLLAENVPLARAIHTGKARSELIVCPLLVELRRLCDRRISLFSGTDFNVDPEQGLTGACDFLISRSSEQFYISAPVLAIVEAKRDNMKEGLGQCIAEMMAAQLFNQREGTGISVIYGMVTTGTNWQPLQLEGHKVWIDREEYYIEQAGKVLGILFRMANGGEEGNLANAGRSSLSEGKS